MKDKDIRDQINDIIEADIQLGINDYIESKQEEKEESGGVGFVPQDVGKELKVKVSNDEVDKIVKEYKRIKKFKKSNLGQVQNLGLVDKHGKPL